MKPPIGTIPKPITPIIIREICEEEGLSYWIEPEYGYIGYVEYPDRKRHLFRNTNLNVNLLGSVELCKDKEYCAQILTRFGYCVPKGKAFFSNEINEKIENRRGTSDAIEYAASLGYPLMIKPNALSQGTGVMKVRDVEELYTAMDLILDISHVFRIERFHTGKDYRVVIFDDEVISAYERIPLFVIGDGVLTISELLRKKQEDFRLLDRPEVIDMTDIRILGKLKEKEYTMDTILSKNQRLQLLDNANLSTGGESIDVTQSIHPDFQNIAIRATRDIGLRLCGVDIMVGDITRSLAENNGEYVIIEMNGAPGLDNYITSGPEQRSYVKSLYRRIILNL